MVDTFVCSSCYVGSQGMDRAWAVYQILFLLTAARMYTAPE